jgi:hypothetical protein
MPGIATALQHMKALEQRSDGSNAVAAFSHALVDTLPKERPAELLRSTLRALQVKQQRHGALLACLQGAGVLGGSHQAVRTPWKLHCCSGQSARLLSPPLISKKQF